MKTNQEIQAEARQLMVFGGQFQNEQRIAGLSGSVEPVPRVLVNLPMNPAMPGRERHVEVTIAGGALEFRLMERETDIPASDRGERDEDGTLLASSDSAYDVLRTGYELAEEERLAAALERYAERSEDRADPADGEAVAEVEAILETKLLSPADRLRTKAEVVEFLEGRLKPSVLIAHAVERQCSRDGLREQRTERHELKLTIGEP
ncbi:MAG: hypothetical protein ABIY47_18305 [Opitutaceae bacterium]